MTTFAHPMPRDSVAESIPAYRGVWRPRQRSLLLPSLALAAFAVLLPVVEWLAGDWLSPVSPLWALPIALVAGLLARYRETTDENHGSRSLWLLLLSLGLLLGAMMLWPGVN